MKKKFLGIMLLFITLFMITACNSESSEESEESTLKQDLTIIEQDEDGEITKGTLEGYTFTETDEEQDRVKIQMEDGSVMLIVLSNKYTPITIANFKKLVSEKFYDGIIFHRVVTSFVIQAGDPTGTGYSGSDETIKGEFSANGVENSLSHTRGVISMARSNDYDSASSQFFIMLEDNTSLDGNYASFGKVIAGLDLVDKIGSVETDDNDKPIEEQKIKSIRFVTIE